MNYEEFVNLTEVTNEHTSYAKAYQLADGSIFYLESVFYTKLMRFQERFPDRFEDILKEMDATVKKHHKVIFVGDYEYPVIDIEGYIMREITDLTNALRINLDDIYRGSDYGD